MSAGREPSRRGPTGGAGRGGPRSGAKSAEAFRTISEVAEDVGVPQHVLRFWETRFAQVKPMKRNGGRRLYRPDHVLLLHGIRALLYDDGLTIKGVQKVLREQGTRSVVARGRTEVEGGPKAEALVPPPDAAERLAALRKRLEAASEALPGAADEEPAGPASDLEADGDGPGDAAPRVDPERVRASIARLEDILARLEGHGRP